MSVPAEQLPDSNTGDITISLQEFVGECGSELLEKISKQNPPVYDGNPCDLRTQVMECLKRRPFARQQEVVQALARYLFDLGECEAVLNAEMGCGKTIMAIALATIAFHEGRGRTLIIAPPHLVYKWRREILSTVPDARVWVLNGPDTIAQLIRLKEELGCSSDRPEFYVLGRVRMRMGFHWKPCYALRKSHVRKQVDKGTDRAGSTIRTNEYVACPDCFEIQSDIDGNPLREEDFPDDRQHKCEKCRGPLWTLMHPKTGRKSRRELVSAALRQIPTIGMKTAEKLISEFGADLLENVLSDNVYEFVNLMDENGEFVFTDRNAVRIERSLANLEFGFGQGGYQPSEYIKRYLPDGYFDLLIADEGHEYKNEGSAQGQAMGVLASKVRKVLLLTGTLMGGYASDLFFLLWRMNPQKMIEDGYRATKRGTLGPAALEFMRDHGILKDTYRETEQQAHRTSKGKRYSVRTSKAPGFGPAGIMRYIVPITVFMKLREIGEDVLPPYNEDYQEVLMTESQHAAYERLSHSLTSSLKEALRKGDTSLLGVVINVLLAWPDCCFRPEVVKHPRTRQLLARQEALFDENEVTPKEQRIIDICCQEKAEGRRVMVYTTYTGKRDTASRLKALMSRHGLRVAVLRSSVETKRREDWILDQVDRGVDVVVCNPELVKTGLDLLDFPTLVFLQSGYNVYTVWQAARRSWRIGQKEPVRVIFLGYRETAQVQCLALMARKISVAQSTSGDMPETGLDVLDQDGDSIEIALAKQLAA